MIDFKSLLKAERASLKEKSKEDVSKKCSPESSSEDVDPGVGMTRPFIFPFLSLEPFRMGSIPNLFYIPNFLSEEDENYLLMCINESGSRPGVWQQLRTRRLQCWGGLPSVESNVKDNLCILPHWLESLVEALTKSSIFTETGTPNHVLVNQYKAGEGILHHTDGPAYMNRVAILSLGSSAKMTFRPNLRPYEIGYVDGSDVAALILRPRSLLIFSDTIYSEYMHGIEPVLVDIISENPPCLNLTEARVTVGDEIPRSTRTSLTLRRRISEH